MDSPPTMTAPENSSWFLPGSSEMARLMREKDWSQTPVGAIEQWPQSLRTALSILLDSGYPMYIAWGEEFTQFYNDAFRPILGSTKHPEALGQSSVECFAEIWDFIGPMFHRVMNESQSTTLIDQLMPLNRHGYAEECYFTFSYSAVRGESAQVGGVFVTCMETTEKVVGERRLRTLRELATHASETRDLSSACREIVRTLAANQQDVPFALLYLLDDAGTATLCESTGLAPGTKIVPGEVLLDGGESFWPFADVARTGQASLPVGLASLRGEFQSDAWPEPLEQAVVLPLTGKAQGKLTGFLVAGISPRRALDESYASFLQLTATQTSTAIANARAYEQERKRTEALAELDRAKTVFFSNVSHEFRTPLTLILGPLEDSLAAAGGLPDSLRENLDIARRNSLRLLRLVNTLLDFSRIESGRIQARYRETNISELTMDLASSFRSAVERAGMRLIVETGTAACMADVDEDMWEKIVFNLLSNA